MSKGLMLAGAAVVTLLAAGTASAAGPAPLSTPEKSSLVEKTHAGDRHRSCSFTQRLGWHYHRFTGRVVSCRPARPRGAFWIWRSEGGRIGWWHNRERRWN